MSNQQIKNVGIGFATGRKSFQQILKTYAYSFFESGVSTKKSINTNVFVAYDLTYNNTKRSDFTNVSDEVTALIDRISFIGNTYMRDEISELISRGVIDEHSAKLLFSSGYAGKRNSIVYAALKQGMDSLLFLDDDEYPMAVTKTRAYPVWSGQQVLSTHLEYIENADITHGNHCGYISPIPHFEFSDILKEEDFRIFIEAISNDILNWDNIRSVMQNGGVTYADTNVLISEEALSVREINGAKFISGANLCINLTDPSRVFAFYNPPGARGEDTFLSTLLSERDVLRVPCYTFHDGFSTYNHIMEGVLPTKLRRIEVNEAAVVIRFLRACVGWVRYKPLLLYITKNGEYEALIQDMREKLAITLPKICDYFEKKEFMFIQDELEKYHKNVQNHYAEFQAVQSAWGKICKFLSEPNDFNSGNRKDDTHE